MSSASEPKHGRGAGDRQQPADEQLFAALLHAPDRESCPGANPILSWREDDDANYLDELERYGVGHYELTRRGVWHGRWTELSGVPSLPKAPRADALQTAQQRRWHAAEPILMRRVVGKAWQDVRALAQERVEAHARWLASATLAEEAPAEFARALDGSRFAIDGSRTGDIERADPERDLFKRAVVDAEGDAGLWIKLARLSTFEEDASLRLRVSFGEEGADDSNPDRARHQRVRALAEALLPEVRELGREREFTERLDRLCGCKTTFSQHIAYWNTPEGGALFHHDAFDEDPAERQLGVAFVQLAGRTAWLALSIEKLAERAGEFLELLAEGELAWVSADLERIQPLAAWRDDFSSLDARLAELALPGCGRLAHIVNRGPEFTSLLADAGHAFVLRPGDALLLPNHGLGSTAMHSVFCASPETTYGVSLAIRRR